MKVFLFVAHGSRKEASNAQIDSFFQDIAGHMTQDFDKSACCFLQFGSPTLNDLLTDMYQSGARDVTIFPYFLFSGAHVTQDIPQIAGDFAAKHPDVRVQVLNPLKDLDGFDRFIAQGISKEIKP